MLTSVHLMLIAGSLVEGTPQLRGKGVLASTAEDAWSKLLTTGEVYLWLHGENLADVRVLYAEWVFGQGATVGETQVDAV